MAIQWFPGHMRSARRKAAETMACIDVVIEVVDARLPEASTNPMVHELRLFRQRPCLKILNKADMADANATKMWLNEYNRQKDMHAVAISSKNIGDVARIPDLCQKLAPHRDDNLKPLRMMIMGIPNVGKSTLMNALLKRRVAAVGDEPGITKDQQSFDLSPQRSITDTPGLLWPKIKYPSDGLMLAASNAVGRNAIIDDEVAIFLAEILLIRYPECITKRYGFSVEGLDSVAVIENIAQKRGFRLRGGKFDFEKASVAFLQDYRDGTLGRISLETPETRNAMLKTTPQAVLLLEDPPETEDSELGGDQTQRQNQGRKN